MKFWKYLVSAFNARPLGVPIPPNWLGLTIVGLLSIINPGFAIIGAGCELFYLYSMVNSKRFRMTVDGQEHKELAKAVKEKIDRQVYSLTYDLRERWNTLTQKCRVVIAQQKDETPTEELRQQADGLSRLSGFYLKLLLSKNNIENIPVKESFTKQINSLNKKIKSTENAELRHSYQGQLDMVLQREQNQDDIEKQHEYIDSELERIEQQIELLKEQTVASTSPHIVSERIDSVTATLSGTNYLKEHRKMFNQFDETFSSPPPIIEVD